MHNWRWMVPREFTDNRWYHSQPAEEGSLDVRQHSRAKLLASVRDSKQQRFVKAKSKLFNTLRTVEGGCWSYRELAGGRVLSTSSLPSFCAKLEKGPVLLISPLLALMRNQISAAERIGKRSLLTQTTKTIGTGSRLAFGTTMLTSC